MSQLKYYTDGVFLAVLDVENNNHSSLGRVQGIVFDQGGVNPIYKEISYEQAAEMRRKFTDHYRSQIDHMDSAF